MRGYVWAVRDDARREFLLSHSRDPKADLHPISQVRAAEAQGWTVVLPV